MQQKDNQQRAQSDELAGKGHGAQGIDKAPGEEPAQDDVNFSQEALKGKKVDGDPGQQSDQPARQDL